MSSWISPCSPPSSGPTTPPPQSQLHRTGFPCWKWGRNTTNSSSYRAVTWRLILCSAPRDRGVFLQGLKHWVFHWAPWSFLISREDAEAARSSFLVCTLSRGRTPSSPQQFPAPIPDPSEAAGAGSAAGARLLSHIPGSSPNDDFDLHRSWEIWPFPSSLLNRTQYMLTGQTPGTLEGGWGALWSLKRFQKLLIYFCKVYLYRCLVSIGMICFG